MLSIALALVVGTHGASLMAVSLWQARAMVDARQTIVDGAVGIVQTAIEQLAAVSAGSGGRAPLLPAATEPAGLPAYFGQPRTCGRRHLSHFRWLLSDSMRVLWMCTPCDRGAPCWKRLRKPSSRPTC